MRAVDLATYSERHRQFATAELPPLLERVASAGVIADVGCGDGAVLHALHVKGLLGARAYGIDLSAARVARAERVPGVTGIVADATRIPLPDGSADGVICSQVIEHVPDQEALVSEIARLLRPGGWWYVGSVLRGSHAWWIYKRDGRRWLDPTHLREYRSEAEFTDAIEHPALQLSLLESRPMRYPLLDLAFRTLRISGDAYVRVPLLARLRGVRLRVPGYRLVEASGIKRS